MSNSVTVIPSAYDLGIAPRCAHSNVLMVFNRMYLGQVGDQSPLNDDLHGIRICLIVRLRD